MPIEIKELVIRAIVEPGGSADKKQPDSGAKKQSGNDETVAECVEQVLEILRRQRER